jgi:hypothetical protein
MEILIVEPKALHPNCLFSGCLLCKDYFYTLYHLTCPTSESNIGSDLANEIAAPSCYQKHYLNNEWHCGLSGYIVAGKRCRFPYNLTGVKNGVKMCVTYQCEYDVVS